MHQLVDIKPRKLPRSDEIKAGIYTAKGMFEDSFQDEEEFTKINKLISDKAIEFAVDQLKRISKEMVDDIYDNDETIAAFIDFSDIASKVLSTVKRLIVREFSTSEIIELGFLIGRSADQIDADMQFRIQILGSLVVSLKVAGIPKKEVDNLIVKKLAEMLDSSQN